MPMIVFFLVAGLFAMLVISDMSGVKPPRLIAFEAMGTGCEFVMVVISLVLIGAFVVIGLVWL